MPYRPPVTDINAQETDAHAGAAEGCVVDTFRLRRLRTGGKQGWRITRLPGAPEGFQGGSEPGPYLMYPMQWFERLCLSVDYCAFFNRFGSVGA